MLTGLGFSVDSVVSDSSCVSLSDASKSKLPAEDWAALRSRGSPQQKHINIYISCLCVNVFCLVLVHMLLMLGHQPQAMQRESATGTLPYIGKGASHMQWGMGADPTPFYIIVVCLFFPLFLWGGEWDVCMRPVAAAS